MVPGLPHEVLRSRPEDLGSCKRIFSLTAVRTMTRFISRTSPPAVPSLKFTFRKAYAVSQRAAFYMGSGFSLTPARGPFMKTFFLTTFARDLALKYALVCLP